MSVESATACKDNGHVALPNDDQLDARMGCSPSLIGSQHKDQLLKQLDQIKQDLNDVTFPLVTKNQEVKTKDNIESEYIILKEEFEAAITVLPHIGAKLFKAECFTIII